MAEGYPVGVYYDRKDGFDKVTGKTVYGADFGLPGQLYGALCRSPHAHARILSINSDKARALPGVRAIITGYEYKNLYGQFIADQPILAVERARYWGEPVAAVAADDERTAREAAKLIEVEYEPLPVVDTIEKSLAGDTLLHDWDDYQIIGATHPEKGTNIVDKFVLACGDVEEGFAKSDVVIENQFYCSMIHHSTIETHCAVAVADEKNIHVYTPAQSPFAIRGVIARAFGYSLDRVRITCLEIGGGFGSKAEAKAEPIAIALALASKRPVKLVFDRQEEFTGALVRAPVLFKIKTGAKNDGTLVSQKVEAFWDTGAYATFGPRVNYNAGYAAIGPYRVPNALSVGKCLVTNKPLGTAYRGFGITEVACAHEFQMDMLAERLQMDPLDLRLKNTLKDGDISVTGETMNSAGVSECLERAADAIGWREKPLCWKTPEGNLRGKGIACFIKICGTPSTTSCMLRLNEDGTLVILAGCREMGQGVTTTLPMIAGAALGLDPEKITVSPVDTAFSPYDKTTTSSRSTFHTGNAILDAVEKIKDQLCKLAAIKWKVHPGEVRYEDGAMVCGSNRIDINEVGKSGILREQPPVLATGSYGTSDIFDEPDPETHASKRPTIMWMMGAQAAEVEVNPKDGRVKVIKVGAAHDVGKAINHLGCYQQIEGGVIMGLGHAIMEEMLFKDGVPLNGNMVDYKVPTSMDADVDIECIFVEHAHPEGPYGAKGLGEPGAVPTAPAIVGAINNATGRKYVRIPVKPEHILFGEEAPK